MKYKFILIISIFFVISCKTDKKNSLFHKKMVVKREKQSKNDINSEKDTIKSKNNLTLNYLQGIWRSYSYYLEHEKENKDFHKNEYYKVVNNKKSLEIILKNHDLDSTIVQTYILGFLNVQKSNIKMSNLKNKGNFFVKVKYNSTDEKKIIKIEKDNISRSFESYFDGNDIFDDYFNYQYLNDSIIEKVTFIKLFSLPKLIFIKLKTQSKKDQRNYIKEFNIKGFSQKIKVTAGKTYFYNDKELKNKRKAFLVKGDVAYLENVGEKGVQVYFDGKVVTAGYLNKDDVQILK